MYLVPRSDSSTSSARSPFYDLRNFPLLIVHQPAPIFGRAGRGDRCLRLGTRRSRRPRAVCSLSVAQTWGRLPPRRGTFGWMGAEFHQPSGTARQRAVAVVVQRFRQGRSPQEHRLCRRRAGRSSHSDLCRIIRRRTGFSGAAGHRKSSRRLEADPGRSFAAGGWTAPNLFLGARQRSGPLSGGR